MISSDQKNFNLSDASARSNLAPVSVVIPCYQCVDTIRRAVSSVAAQSLRPFELILVDDGSRDNTLPELHAIREAYGSDWVKVIDLSRNHGVSVARNAGWNAATQDYIAFLDADDSWHPRKIEFQYAWMSENPQVAISGHRCMMVDPIKQAPTLDVDANFSVRYLSKRRLVFSNPFVTPSFMLKRDLPYRFNPARRYTEDFLLLLQIGLDGHPIAMLDVELVYKYGTFGESGLSSNLLKMRVGDLQNYWQLWRSKRLSFIGLSALSAYSSLKFAALLLLGPERYELLNQRLNKSQRRL